MNPGPQHIGFILDGNRRYARKLALQPWKGHDMGKDKVEKVLHWCKELGVTEVTVYAFSLQNFKRAKQEVDYLMNLTLRAYRELLDSTDPDVKKTRIHIMGRLHLLPPEVREVAEELNEKTKDYGPYRFNVAFAYGGREEIVDACKAIAAKVKAGKLDPEDIDTDLLTQHMYLQSEPDMIIRTSGEQRTSNFLLWQSWYSEWFFPQVTWPAFEKEDLVRCVEEFKKRDRRFGGK